MDEKVRRVRLLLAVSAAGLLAFLAAWPSQGAVSDPAPLYLARDRDADQVAPGTHSYLVVADAARIATHIMEDGENIADLEIIDSSGLVVDLAGNGEVVPTGRAIPPSVVQSWLQDSFAFRLKGLNGQLNESALESCSSSVLVARSRLTLPTHRGDRELTLAETLAEADARLAAMHRPENQLPTWCLRRYPQSDHRAGYLHNLWHRVTGTS